MNRRFYVVLAAWFSLALAVMFGVTAAVYSSLRESGIQYRRVLHTRDVLSTLSEAFSAVLDAESNGRGYAFTGNPAFVEKFTIAKSQVVENADELEALVGDNPAQSALALELRAKLLEKLALSSRVIDLSNRADAGLARNLIGGDSVLLRDQIAELVRRMRVEETRLLSIREVAADNARIRALAFGAAGVSLSVVIIGLVFALVRKEGRHRMIAEAELAASHGQVSESLQTARRLMQEMRTVDRLAEFLASCASIDDAREVISKQMRQALPDTCGAVYLFRPSRNLVEIVARWNEPKAPSRAASFALEECWALKSGNPHVWLTNEDVRCAHIDTGVEAAVCLPMNVHGETIGVIHYEGPSARFDALQLALIGHLTDRIGTALSTLRLQQRLRDQAFIDPLTGLFNRRFLEVAIEKDVSRVDRKKTSLGLVMIDIDHFKRVNDQHGHEAGDQILKGVSETLRTHTRSQDVLCRYGGEEFLLVMFEASLASARIRGEALRLAVERRLFVVNGESDRRGVTISLGVSTYPEFGATWQDSLRVADQALYRAKHEGRNRVCVALNPDEEPSQGDAELPDDVARDATTDPEIAMADQTA